MPPSTSRTRCGFALRALAVPQPERLGEVMGSGGDPAAPMPAQPGLTEPSVPCPRPSPVQRRVDFVPGRRRDAGPSRVPTVMPAAPRSHQSPPWQVS